jgi:hypothetical protein
VPTGEEGAIDRCRQCRAVQANANEAGAALGGLLPTRPEFALIVGHDGKVCALLLRNYEGANSIAEHNLDEAFVAVCGAGEFAD